MSNHPVPFIQFVYPSLGIKDLPYGFCTCIQDKISVKEIKAASDVTHPTLGVPNPTSSQCMTCDAKNVKTCEGGNITYLISLVTVLHILNLC